MRRLQENLVVVVHQVRLPDNLGAIARIMANFEFATLRVSDPYTKYFDEARKLAVRSESILDQLEVHPSLPQAIQDVVYACGTTSRTAVEGRRVMRPEEAVQKLRKESERGRVALVFGGERRGLSDEDLSHCQDYLCIPTGETQPSMNLGQSAAVLLYLCSQVEKESTPVAAREPGARLQTVQALEKMMKETLLTSGFLNPQSPDYILKELQRALLSGQLTQREAELWIGAFKQLRFALSKATTQT